MVIKSSHLNVNSAKNVVILFQIFVEVLGTIFAVFPSLSNFTDFGLTLATTFSKSIIKNVSQTTSFKKNRKFVVGLEHPG
jgi:hypothetical protein